MAEKINPKVNPATVAALLENARQLAHDEEARGASLKSRASWLLGFLGVILTIVLTQVSTLATGQDLGSTLTPLAAAAALLAILALLNAGRWALKTLSIVQLWHVGPGETDRYPTWECIGKETSEAQGEMLRGWVRQFKEEREANNLKAAELESAFRWLIGGLLVLAVLMGIVALRAFGVE